jgi:hypothetical protein
MSDSFFISFLTDIEGDDEYFHRFVSQSRVVTFREVVSSDRCHQLPYPFPYKHCLEFHNNTIPPGCHSNDHREIHKINTSTTPGDVEETHDMLVLGGDTWDRGCGDLYVIRQLLFFQLRYPTRVHFIMGNRDTNKMRLHTELGGMEITPSVDNLNMQHWKTIKYNVPFISNSSRNSSLPLHGGVYWMRGTGNPADPIVRETFYNSKESESAADRLRWILKYSMGSPNAFENRRCELIQERQGSDVTDDDVVDSYRRSCHPVIGEMALYLSRAKLFVTIGDTLFMHDALPPTTPIGKSLENRLKALRDNQVYNSSIWDDLTFAMPWLISSQKASDCNVFTVTDWFQASNIFASRCVHDWRCRGWKQTLGNNSLTAPVGVWSTLGGYHTPFPLYTQLLQLTKSMTSWTTGGMPRRFFDNNNKKHIDGKGKLEGNIDMEQQQLDDEYVRVTHEFVQHANLSVICVGHQPQGDFPCPIRLDLRHEDRLAWIFSADTSFSGDVIWDTSPLHGEATSSSTIPAVSNMSHRKGLGRGGRNGSARGDYAVCEVLLEMNALTRQVQSIQCHGVLSDGTRYETSKYQTLSTLEPENLLVGKLAPQTVYPSYGITAACRSPWWVKAKILGTPPSYLVSHGQGFDQWNRILVHTERNER